MKNALDEAVLKGRVKVIRT